MVASAQQLEVSAFDGLLKGQRSVKFWLPRALALAASVIGPLPLVMDLKFHISMSGTALVLWPLSFLLVIVSILLATRSGDRHFVKTVLVAAVAGSMATATYDSTRVAAISAGITEMDEALDFGRRLTSQTGPGHGAAHGGEQTAPKVREHSDAQPSHRSVGLVGTVAIGYAWHYWAGMMFSLGFLMLFGARRWWWAIPYLVLVIYPGMVFTMGFHSRANFVWEAVGHAGFGLTLAIVTWALLGREHAGLLQQPSRSS